jgi:hypothetical protein
LSQDENPTDRRVPERREPARWIEMSRKTLENPRQPIAFSLQQWDADVSQTKNPLPGGTGQRAEFESPSQDIEEYFNE